MKVSELGEFGLIELLADIIDRTRNPQDISWQQLLIGIGDDSAAWKCENPIQLATTDSRAQIANQFGVAIVGGNIASASKTMISVTVLGNLESTSALTRSSAAPGDQVAVTGYLGLSAAGLRMLQQHLK